MPVLSSRSFRTRRSAALRSIPTEFRSSGYEPDTMNRSIIFGVLIASAIVPSAASAQELTVYSSLPLSGAARGQTQAVNDGARQALQEAGGMAGGRAVRLVM